MSGSGVLPVATPLAVTVFCASPLVEAGIWALLHRDRGGVESVPLGPRTEVIVAFVRDKFDAAALPDTDAPVIAVVSDRGTARLMKTRGALPVPLSIGGKQLMRVLEAVREQTTPGRGTHRPVEGLPVPLTAREIEVLDKISAGLSNADIAAELFLSINSIKTYIRSAYRKIDVVTRPQAVIWGIQHGFGR